MLRQVLPGVIMKQTNNFGGSFDDYDESSSDIRVITQVVTYVKDRITRSLLPDAQLTCGMSGPMGRGVTTRESDLCKRICAEPCRV